MKNKANNRGFFPSVKGKFGKAKGMGKSKGKGSTPVMAASTSSSNHGKGKQRPGEPSYTGCFICGSREHSFQQCPRRHQQRGGHANYVDVLMVGMVPEEGIVENGSISEEFCPEMETVSAWTVQPHDDQCHAVIDCGATENRCLPSCPKFDHVQAFREVWF